MIEHLTIRDFQSIEELDIECGSITVIHGESDTGKSAVVRALYALAFNDYPKGHVRDGAKASEVSVTVSGEVVRAFKGGGTNGYELQRPEKSEKWDKVGTEVPAEVTDQLGWRVLELDDGSKFTPSFQQQFDAPFLLTDTPSRRAKVLGTLTNVATLYAAIKEANGWERKAKIRGDTQQEILLEVEATFPALEQKVEESKAELFELHALIGKARDAEVKRDKLETIHGRLTDAQETVNIAKASIVMLEGSNPVTELQRADVLIPRLQGLTALEFNLQSSSDAVRVLEEEVADLDHQAGLMSHEVQKFHDEYGICPMCGSAFADGGHDHE